MFHVDEQGVRWYAPALRDVREPEPVAPYRQWLHESLIGLDPALAERREARICDGPADPFAARPLALRIAAINRVTEVPSFTTSATGRRAPTAVLVPAASVVMGGPHTPNGPNTTPLSSYRGSTG